jgi:hypothetical protein
MFENISSRGRNRRQQQRGKGRRDSECMGKTSFSPRRCWAVGICLWMGQEELCGTLLAPLPAPRGINNLGHNIMLYSTMQSDTFLGCMHPDTLLACKYPYPVRESWRQFLGARALAHVLGARTLSPFVGAFTLTSFFGMYSTFDTCIGCTNP